MNITDETPRSTITIAGVVVECPQPFAEGHILSANEAAALNQTFSENIRNNLAKHFKENAENSEFDPQAAVDEYVPTYSFGVRRGRSVADPIEREAYRMALESVKEALKNAGYKLKEVGDEKLEDMVAQALETYPVFREKAKALVESRVSIGLDSLME